MFQGAQKDIRNLEELKAAQEDLQQNFIVESLLFIN